jgi:ABC-type transport system involved in multi-copper enzyme maturation permease subunit
MTGIGVGPSYQSRLDRGHENFWQLIHAEWTKLRTVHAWLITLALGVALTIGFGVLSASGTRTASSGKPVGPKGAPYLATGPGGEAVADTYYFVHQSLTGDGTITARVTSLVAASSAVGGQKCPAGMVRGNPPPYGSAHCAKASGSESGPPPAALQPWAKAGLIVTPSTAQGSPYAAVMVTPGHGVRMQWDYTNDRAGLPGAVSADSPRWLRLRRSGDTVTALESTDGKHWTTIGTAVLAGWPSTVQVGLFVTAPVITVSQSTIGGRTAVTNPTLAAGTFDDVTISPHGRAGTWLASQVAPKNPITAAYAALAGGATHSGGTFRVSGSGDIAPAVGGPAAPSPPLETVLVGGFLGLLVIVVLATLFVTGEYRRGLIRTTLVAWPRRAQVLAAKAIVIAGVSFATGLVAFAPAIEIGRSILRSNGNFIYPVSVLTQVRLVAGLSLVLAVGAVLALAIATIARRGAGVIAGLIVAFVLPQFLAGSAILPDGPGEWVLRVTPAAGFAIEQSLPRYFQVSSVYTPAYGYYPLSPWAGFLVLCAYAAAALGLALYLFRRRDA